MDSENNKANPALDSGDESPRGGVGGSEHCVAILTRKARILYIYKAKRRLK